MFESWEIIVLMLTAVLSILLVFMTVMEIVRRRKVKRRKPQDHYFANRKKEN